MKPRDTYLEKGKSLDDSGTYIVELSVVDPITELFILVAATNGATHNKNSPIARCIQKIELVDGSDVLFSMDGRLAQAVFFYLTGKLPMMALQEYPGASQIGCFPIRFGRWLWDRDLALVPAKFRNLQLKITWDLAAVNAVGATGFVSGSAELHVLSRVMEEMEAEPSGFLMHKNHYSFTSAASGDEPVVLPTDYPYALLIQRAWEAGTGINSTLTNLKLSIDQDKYIPFDMSAGAMMRLMDEIWGDITLKLRGYGDDGDTKQVWLAAHERAAITLETDPGNAGFHDLVNGQMVLDLQDDAGASLTDKMVQIIVHGQGLWNTVCYPFGILTDPATYLPAQDYSSIKLKLTQGNAGAEMDTVLTQLRTY